ncbi:MAG TPA: hypothetical protein PKD31_21295, partial [Blastocatellia bacterium]|nr:hypothetical protein [Blastocatellia bacterium]
HASTATPMAAINTGFRVNLRECNEVFMIVTPEQWFGTNNRNAAGIRHKLKAAWNSHKQSRKHARDWQV